MKVNCPTCRKEVQWSKESIYRPFCCKRCQLIDLGEWAGEEKRIKGDPVSTDNQHQEDNSIYFD